MWLDLGTMHHFAVAVSLDRNKELALSVAQFIETKLIFRPEVAICTRVAGALVASFQVNRAAYGVDSWTFFDDESAVLVFGLPTFEEYTNEIVELGRRRPAEAIRKIIEKDGFESLYGRLGGVYSVIFIKNSEIRTTATFCGYGTFFYHKSSDLLVVGNKIPLILSMVPTANISPNYGAAASICSTTMVLGNQSPYIGVDKVKAGHDFRGDIQSTDLIRRSPRFTDPPRDDESKPIDRLIRRYEYLLDLPLRWQAHITGGKDSRAALAAILASGRSGRVTSFRTSGSDENGDVIIARQIAAFTGIENHHVIAGAKASNLSESDIDGYYDRFNYSAWRYDGQLTSWDGAGKPTYKRPQTITLMGGGGEIYRQKGIRFPKHDFESCVSRLAGWSFKFNQLGIVSSDAAAEQKESIRSYIAEQFVLGTVNLQPSLYINHRLSNWGATHFQSNASPSVAGLIDLSLAQLMQRSDDCRDEIHYEVIRQCYPDLLKIPLSNDTWELLPKEEQNPLLVPISKNFPWQYQVIEKKWKKLIGEVIDGRIYLDNVIDKEKLEYLYNNDPPSINSASIKMIFGARTLISLYSGGMRGTPDFMGENYMTECRGEYSIYLRESLSRAGFECSINENDV